MGLVQGVDAVEIIMEIFKVELPSTTSTSWFRVNLIVTGSHAAENLNSFLSTLHSLLEVSRQLLIQPLLQLRFPTSSCLSDSRHSKHVSIITELTSTADPFVWREKRRSRKIISRLQSSAIKERTIVFIFSMEHFPLFVCVRALCSECLDITKNSFKRLQHSCVLEEMWCWWLSALWVQVSQTSNKTKLQLVPATTVPNSYNQLNSSCQRIPFKAQNGTDDGI